MFACAISMALFSVHMNKASSMILQPLQKEEVNVTQWDKMPPKKEEHWGNRIEGVVKAIDDISVTVLPTSRVYEETLANGMVVEEELNRLVEKFGHKKVRVYFVGDLRKGKVPLIMPFWHMETDPPVLFLQAPLYCEHYRAKDIKVGDHITMSGMSVYNDKVPITSAIQIWRRPGGLVPPLPDWKPEPGRDRVSDLGYHERVNLRLEHEAKGLPEPTDDDYIRRYMPKAWAKKQREKQLESIPYIKD